MPAVHSAAHYTGYDHGPGVPSTTVGLDIILGVEEAKPVDPGADYPERLNSLSHRPSGMEPFRWYPYNPSGRPIDNGGGGGAGGGGGYYKPSRWPEGHGAEGISGQGRPEGDQKPTVLYLEGDKAPGAEGRPDRPQLLPDPEKRPERPDFLDRPGRPYRPDPLDRPYHSVRPQEQRPLYPPVDAFICPNHHSCSDSVWDRRDTSQSLSWSDRGCFCDEQCQTYGDCCRDAPALSESQDGVGQDMTNQGVIAKDTQLKLRAKAEDGEPRRLTDQQEEEDKFECRSVPAFSTLHSTPVAEEKWYMMSDCPREFDGYDNKVRCEVPGSATEDPLTALPVTSVTTNITYSSLFCAMCHNDTDDIAFWQLGLRCPDITAHGPTEQKLLERLRRTSNGWGMVLDSGRIYHCELTARPPVKVQPRPCLALHQRCPRTSPLHEACENHTAVVYVAGRAFRNVYCARCAGGRPSEVRCSAPCSASERPADIGGLRMRLSIAPGLDERCEETEIRDPFSRRCRSMVCSRLGYSLVDGACIKTDQGRGDRGEDGNTTELLHPDDNFLPMHSLVDTENAIQVELVDAQAPSAAAAAVVGEQAPGVENSGPQQLNVMETGAEAEAAAVAAAAAAAGGDLGGSGDGAPAADEDV